MGFPPPISGPAPGATTTSSPFGAPVAADSCGFSLRVPTVFVPSFKLPSLAVGPLALANLIPHLGFKLSCADPTLPIAQAQGVPWGGGRTPNYEPDPDDDENAY